MTAADALAELLARIGAGGGAPVLLSEAELDQWPGVAVAAMKAGGLLVKAAPAASLVCPGCEQQCSMPVEVVTNETSGAVSAFVVCDKRDDINRVPIGLGALEQWQAGGGAVAALLARILGLRPSGADDAARGRWDVGVLKGARHASHLTLLAGSGLTLSVAGHSLALADVLELKGGRFTADRRLLVRLVNQPAAGGGDIESAEERRCRLRARVSAVRGRGVRAFLKTVAAEEGISVSRLKQLVN